MYRSARQGGAALFEQKPEIAKHLSGKKQDVRINPGFVMPEVLKFWSRLAIAALTLCLLGLCFEPELNRWWNLPAPGKLGVDYLGENFAGSCLAEACLVSLPASYHQQSAWPLLVFLHGSGERGNEPEDFRHHAEFLLQSLDGYSAVVVLPQCRPQHGWSANDVHRFMVAACQEYNINPQRVYLTGYSMGGYGTWETAAAYPNSVAAIVPVAGGCNAGDAVDLTNIPTWAFHGNKDDVVRVENSTRLVDAIREAGGSPKVTLYPLEKHGILKKVFSTPELWDWLFQQKLQPFPQ